MPDRETKFKEHDGVLRRRTGALLDADAGVPLDVFAVTGIVLVATVMALGGIPPTTACLFTLGASVALALLAVRAGRWNTHLFPGVSGVFAGLAAWSLLQCVPLPMSVLRVVSAGSAEVWSGALLPLRADPMSFAPVSVAPEATLVEAAKWAGYAAMAWLGFAWSRSRGPSGIAYLVLGIAVTVGLVTLLHGWLGATKLFGWYAPQVTFPRWRMGPLLNANHLSGMLNLGAFAGISLLLTGRGAASGRTGFLAIAVGGLVVGVVLLASRGGFGSLVLGAFAAVALQWQARRRDASVSPSLAGLGVLALIAAAFGLALLGYSQAVLLDLSEKDISKLRVARDCIPLVKTHWLAGAGRGAFEGVYWAYKTVPDWSSWTHAESLPVQWLTEWGVVVPTVASALFVRSLVRARGLRESLQAKLLLLALGVLTVHNLVDFSLELPGVAGIAALVLGAVCGTPPRKASKAHRDSGTARSPIPHIACAAAIAASGIFALVHAPEALSSVRAQAFAASQGPGDMTRFASWMRRYPADPFVPLYGGVAASRARPAAGLPWFNRALERAPNMVVVHLAVAEVLARSGLRTQALLHVRTAMQRDATAAASAAEVATKISHRSEDLIGAAPPGSPGASTYLERVAVLLPAGSASARAVRDHALSEYPCANQLRAALIHELVDDVEKGRGACSSDGRPRCLERARAELDRLAACPDTAPIVGALRADLAWASGDKVRAIAETEQACALTDKDNTGCLKRLAERATEVRDAERVRRIARIVVARECAAVASCGEAWAWNAGVLTRLGDLGGAFAAAGKAVVADPANPDLRWLYVEAAIAIGAHERAAVVLEEILAKWPGDERARVKLASVRSAMAAARPQPSAAPATPRAPAGRPLPRSRRETGQLENADAQRTFSSISDQLTSGT